MNMELLWETACTKIFKLPENKDDHIELFECKEDLVVGCVNTTKRSNRKILQCSSIMNKLIDNSVKSIVNKPESFAGFLYIMYKISDSKKVIPLYIGISETWGKNGEKLSKNLENKARWGNGSDFHIGGLSDAIFNHLPRKNKQEEKWATELFESANEPKLKEPIYFHMVPWENHLTGLWEEFGPTSLPFLEIQLINIAYSLFKDDLLNTQGIGRTKKPT